MITGSGTGPMSVLPMATKESGNPKIGAGVRNDIAETAEDRRHAERDDQRVDVQRLGSGGR